MITVIVAFQLTQPMTPAQAREAFLASAPRYRDLAGLQRKYYYLSEDGNTAGGIYLWSSRTQAEQAYDSAWKAFVTDKYGHAPQLTWLHTPVVVDNVSGEILSDPA